MSEKTTSEESAPKPVKFNDFMLDIIHDTIKLLETAESKMSNEDAKKKLKEAIAEAKKKIGEEEKTVRAAPKSTILRNPIPEEADVDKKAKEDKPPANLTPAARRLIGEQLDTLAKVIPSLEKQKKSLFKLPNSSGFGWLAADGTAKILENMAIIRSILSKNPMLAANLTGKPGPFKGFEGSDSAFVYYIILLAIHKGMKNKVPAAFVNDIEYKRAASLSDSARFDELTKQITNEVELYMANLVERLKKCHDAYLVSLDEQGIKIPSPKEAKKQRSNNRSKKPGQRQRSKKR